MLNELNAKRMLPAIAASYLLDACGFIFFYVFSLMFLLLINGLFAMKTPQYF